MQAVHAGQPAYIGGKPQIEMHNWLYQSNQAIAARNQERKRKGLQSEEAIGHIDISNEDVGANGLTNDLTIIDVATLTGAMKVALGQRTGGFFSTDDALTDLDATGLVNLDSAVSRLRRDGVLVVLGGLQPQPLRALVRAGWRGREGVRLFRSLERAVEAIAAEGGDPEDEIAAPR